jgi:asparagine synthase (glutamine-hydrolysing)
VTPVQFALAIPLCAGGVQRRLPKASSDPGSFCEREARFWAGSATPVHALGSVGLGLGHIFGRDGPASLPGVSPDEPSEPDAAAVQLITRFWGTYLAVFVHGDTIGLLPDPGGLMPVFCRMTATHLLVASQARLLFAADGSQPSIDLAALGDFLARPELRTTSTCLEGVRELRPGSITSLQYGLLSERQLWRASRFLPDGKSPSFEEAADLLRHEAVDVMKTWHEALGSPVVAVSGGVDSSLICGALSAAGLPFSCVTLATRDPGGDERSAARQLAGHLGVRLHEEIYSPEDFDPFQSASAGLPRPSRKSFLTRVDAMLAGACSRLGGFSVWDGNGGDNLFCYLHSPAPVVDRLMTEGLFSQWPRTLLDMCGVTGSDIGEMARATLRRFLGRPGFPPWPADARLTRGRAPPFAALSPVAPWDREVAARHGGKQDHLALIMRAQLHCHGPANPVRRFSPLMSQPMLELCLSLPTWLWCHGGINRALARTAFASDLPQVLHRRTSKAGPDSFLRTIFDRNRKIFRELLAGGILDEAGLIDMAAVERALQTDRNRDDPVIYRVLDLVEAENWAREWQG